MAGVSPTGASTDHHLIAALSELWDGPPPGDIAAALAMMHDPQHRAHIAALGEMYKQLARAMQKPEGPEVQCDAARAEFARLCGVEVGSIPRQDTLLFFGGLDASGHASEGTVIHGGFVWSGRFGRPWGHVENMTMWSSCGLARAHGTLHGGALHGRCTISERGGRLGATCEGGSVRGTMELRMPYPSHYMKSDGEGPGEGPGEDEGRCEYRYVGEFQGGVPHGIGTLTWLNGACSYGGQWSQGGASGEGVVNRSAYVVHQGGELVRSCSLLKKHIEDLTGEVAILKTELANRETAGDSDARLCQMEESLRQEHREALNRITRCKVCMGADACHAALPCGHLIWCDACHERQHGRGVRTPRGISCPMCRDTYIRVQKIFL